MNNAELIKALRECGKASENRCGDCVYYDREPWCEAALANDAADALEAADKRIARLEEDLKTREAEREVMQDTIKICEEAADRYKAQLPKEGEWIWDSDTGTYHCSECNATSPQEDQDMEEYGIMLYFSPREYSIRELYDSYNRKETLLSPKFQRRPVWEYKAKSYLIDSILSGFPIPRIFVRERTNLDMSVSREIIDGQQRLKTIFDFLNDGFKISKVHNKDYGGLCYSELPDQVKKDFLKYPISAILLIDIDDNAVFDIFARFIDCPNYCPNCGARMKGEQE